MQGRSLSVAVGLALGSVLAFIFVGGFAVGMVFQQGRADSSAQVSDANLKNFLAAYRLVTQHSYFRPFDRQQLINAAIDGMMTATGDPHTLFLSPQQNHAASVELNGAQFSGIGAIVLPSGQNLQVVTPLPKSPAARAGLKSGDIITQIDRRPVSRMTGPRAIKLIHGRAGSTVRLTVVRNHGRAFSVHVVRARIAPVTAYGRLLPDHLGYIKVLSFGDGTSQEVAQELTLFKSSGVRGIVLDLRQNPGGYVDAAQHVVSEFLSHGIVAYERTTDHRLHALPVLKGLQRATATVAVLVDSGTASAAEITAAALRDNHRGIVLGTQTYGKGSMQSVYSLGDGSSIHITDRLWLTPRKRSIQNKGVRPDIVVPAGAGLRRDAGDPQLRAAENYLVHHALS